MEVKKLSQYLDSSNMVLLGETGVVFSLRVLTCLCLESLVANRSLHRR